MANKTVFASMKGRFLSKTDTTNLAHAPAYSYRDAHALAQLAMTGTFGKTTYQDPIKELNRAVELANVVDPSFLAKAAVYTRKQGHMKDMPALLLAVLASRDPILFRQVFGQVVDNGRMLRTFVQIMRSGQTGRKSLGSAPKRMVANWLNTASDWALLQANIGNDPSLADVIKMVHPKPDNPARDALFAWIIGKPCDLALLPKAVQDFVAFKETGEGDVPDVPFQMLTQLSLSTKQWAQIARDGSWQMVLMNLNTFLRHGVLAEPETRAHIASVLRDPERIAKARVLPYQLMTAYQALSRDIPEDIRDALHDAMEISVRNVPRLSGRTIVCPDVSGSMSGAVTGYRKGATTSTRFVDVAALVSAAILRRNQSALVLPFEVRVRDVRLEPRDTILTNARRLSEQWGGGTNCSAPLEWLHERRELADLVIIVSDNQSWAHTAHGRNGTAMMQMWEKFRERNPQAKLVCIDIAPYGTTQAKEREDVLNIGGFSDTVFDQIAAFAGGKMGRDHWVGEIEAVQV